MRRNYVPPSVDPSKVVSKPQGTGKAPSRDTEIGQIRRRFSPAETATLDYTIFALKLHPTDPDFPFDLEYLDCVLQVPKNYPEGIPTLNVRNKEMERGFQINVEHSFDAIVRASPQSSLLAHMNTLDRQLETILSGGKADTIKFVANVRNGKENDQGSLVPGQKHVEPNKGHEPLPSRGAEPLHSRIERDAAAARRDAETRQLEARLGRHSMFAKSSDGIAYTIPIEPRRRADLPVPLQSIKSLRLFVPMLYPLLPCRIALQGVARESALATERAFEKKAKESPEVTLMGHVNLLATNMHNFAFEEAQGLYFTDMDSEWGFESLDLSDSEAATGPDRKQDQGIQVDDRTHLHVIPRPPEWSFTEEAESDSESDDLDGEPEISSEGEKDDALPSVERGPERGVSINFPNLELHGIELLELMSLSLAVKCLRCKEALEISNLRQDRPSGRQESCKKCASVLAFGRLYLL